MHATMTISRHVFWEDNEKLFFKIIHSRVKTFYRCRSLRLPRADLDPDRKNVVIQIIQYSIQSTIHGISMYLKGFLNY